MLTISREKMAANPEKNFGKKFNINLLYITGKKLTYNLHRVVP